MSGFVCKIADDIENDGAAVTQYLEYEPPKVNMTELLRYSGFPLIRAKAIADGTDDAPDVLETAEKAAKLVEGKLSFKVGYKIVTVKRDEEGFLILPFQQHSEKLKMNMKDCGKAVLFAATIGSGIDMFIRRYERTDTKMALYMQACGAERAEALCNKFNSDVKEAASLSGYKAHPRYSPGFGDLPITVQKEFLSLLDAGRRMGITLGESFLMAPSKSVTAIIGLERL